ncbi:ribonuclease P protein component [Marisediminicola senii]|uniref:ribonuclease P protein component n=1 Tax=Marisediminicola senii TaxID=2711233 RepID=UPI0013EE20A5|nr:ribonuclease P protein component [Marisediminicola senii]
MLARSNRIVHADDYRATVRSGRRSTSPHSVIYLRHNGRAAEPRFGFIVAKSVGNAVTRNLVRRRLKGAAFELLPMAAPGTDLVVRALPAAAQAPWDTLRAQISEALSKGVTRQ